jgi:hypothetical protein
MNYYEFLIDPSEFNPNVLIVVRSPFDVATTVFLLVEHDPKIQIHSYTELDEDELTPHDISWCFKDSATLQQPIFGDYELNVEGVKTNFPELQLQSELN